MADETFTDFMVRCMENEDAVDQAILLVRRGNRTVGYKCFNQEFADTLGLMRVAALSVEHDLQEEWNNGH